ncbi:MAG: CHAT domain-containing protein [Caldilineae bacterium]|nr:MAG: CHAT domain-containing protein [Caldilineae bacterium]
MEAAGPQSVAIGGDVTGSTIITGSVHIHWTATTAPARSDFKRYLRMLAVVAAPVVGRTEADPPPAPLDLWAEWRRLEESVRNAWDVVRGQGAPWAVVRLNPPTRHHLADALAAGDPDAAYQVVHFSGHGAPDGLALEDELGRTDFVTTDELVTLFRNRPVRLVVLNACETEAIARRLHTEAGVPAVIATTDLLRDDEARLLTARLYAWLARGRTVAEAFAEALASLRHAYERGRLPIPAEHGVDPQAYIAARLAVPVLLGDARLDLPPADERAAEPLITLAEPPARGMELGLIEGFVGRGPELVQIARWLRDRPSPVIALSGLGGIGKSALATMALLRGAHRFRAVVALSARGQPHLKPDALVPPLDGVLGQEGRLGAAPTEAERLERAIRALNETPTLLLLDNLEDLSGATTRAWADFLKRLDPRRGSTALLTLRPAVKHPLTDLAGPAHLPLERLGEPDALRLLADGLSERDLWVKVPVVEKLTLAQRTRLEDLARRAHLTWLSLGRLAALDDLAARAGRHPYTLRLALGDLRYPHVDWTKALGSVRDLRGRDWEAQAEAMVGRMVADLATAEPEAVSLLQALLVFEGGATYESLRAVAAPEADEAAFDERLRAVLDASLLEVRGAGETARYDLHPLTRAYLKKRYPRASEMLADLLRRHATYFVKWSYHVQHEHESVILPEIENLKVACTILSEAGAGFEDSLIALVSNVTSALEKAGYWADLIPMLESARHACARKGNKIGQIQFINRLAQMYTNQSAYQQALHWAHVALTLAEQTRDIRLLSEAHLRIGWTCMYISEFARSLYHLKQCKALAEQIGELGLMAGALHFMGRVYAEQGDFEQALSCFRSELSLPPVTRSGGWAFSWLRCAEVALAIGKVRLARRLALRSARQFQCLGQEGGMAYALRVLAQISLREGEAEEAMNLFRQSLYSIGYVRGEMNALQGIVDVYLGLGRYEAANSLVDDVIRYRKASLERKHLAEALYLKGQALEHLGKLNESLMFYEQSWRIFKDIGCLPCIFERPAIAIQRVKAKLSSHTDH